MLYPINDFRELTQRDVSRIARLLNERPRQTLDFKTPKEVFSLLRQEFPSAVSHFVLQITEVFALNFTVVSKLNFMKIILPIRV
ncbi:hypothetical protein AGMMS49579_23700 [Spirochaetia bacterium]|nr:hypothetical protein AGMMS49579_23700 [Spirochaetia bacterium]